MAGDALARVLERASKTRAATVIRDLSGAQALGDEAHEFAADGFDAIRLEREERASLKRVAGLSTELEDVTEVEYRQLRLEKVVLIGVYSQSSKQGTEDAENSLRCLLYTSRCV